MAKRNAASELNHDNWDQEDESEEAGEFKRATDDQMKVNKYKHLFGEWMLYDKINLGVVGSCHKKGKKKKLNWGPEKEHILWLQRIFLE